MSSYGCNLMLLENSPCILLIFMRQPLFFHLLLVSLLRCLTIESVLSELLHGKGPASRLFLEPQWSGLSHGTAWELNGRPEKVAASICHDRWSFNWTLLFGSRLDVDCRKGWSGQTQRMGHRLRNIQVTIQLWDVYTIFILLSEWCSRTVDLRLIKSIVWVATGGRR